MKLHLPTPLRSALLACLASLSPWAPTVATGAIGGGLLALAYGGAALAAEEQGLATTVADPVPYVGTIYTWVGTGADITEKNYYRVTTRNESGEWVLAANPPTEGWWDEWGPGAANNPNAIRFDGTGTGKGLTFTFMEYYLSGIIVETGATGYSIKAEKSQYARNITIGNSGTATAYSTIREDFSISNAGGEKGSPITLRGTQEWTIAEGATLTLSGSVPIAHSGNLTVQGGGAATFASGLALAAGSALAIGDGAEAVVVGTLADNGGTISAEGKLVLQDVEASGLALTIGEKDNYALKGNVSLADLENNGSLDLSGLTQLTIGALQKGGAEVKIGAFTGTTDIVSLITASDWVKITQEVRNGVNYLCSTGVSLYWKGTAEAGGITALWNADTDTTNWSASATATEGNMAFDENYVAEFGDGGCQFVQVAENGVRTPAVHVTKAGYSFSGGTIATSEIWAEQGVSFTGVKALDGRLDIKADEGMTITISSLVGNENGSDAIRVMGKGTLDLFGTTNSFGSLSVEGAATLQLVSYGTDKEVVLSVGNVTLASANGYAKNLVIREGEVKPYDAAAVAELNKIHLTAGTEGQHATVDGVQFTGTANSIGGYIDMGDSAAAGVAAGSSLSISDGGLVVDLGKVSELQKEHTVISLADSSSALKDWEKARFFYNGIEMAGNVLETGTAGKVAVSLTPDKMDGKATLYWDGSPSGVWDGKETNWSDAAGTDGDLTFKAFGNVEFGNVPDGGVKTVEQKAKISVGNMSVTAGGYAFSGAPLKVWGRLDVSAIGETTFGSYVEAVQGIRLGNRAEDALHGITTAVTFEDNIKTDSLALQCVKEGVTQAVQGTYTFQGIEVKSAVFDVDDMRLGGLNDATPRVVVNGSVVADSIDIRGNAAKEFKGAITSKKVTISAGGDDRNVVVFGARGNDIDRLELMDGAKLSLAEDNQNITDIVLGDALLRFEMRSGHYNNSGQGYNIYSSHDKALLEMAGITYTTIDKLSGREGTTGEFHSVTLDSMGRSLNINHLENLKDLTILSGTAEIGENVADWAEGGVHHDLIIKEEASVRLYKDNIMARGSHEMRVEDSILQLLGTTQTLYAAAGGAGNAVHFDYADVLGSSTGTGLHVVQAASGTPGTLDVTFGHINDVAANMSLDAGTTVHFNGAAGASLSLSGVVSGAGDMVMEGAGSSVALMGQNTLTGTVTAGKGTELVIGNKNALQNAHLVMGAGSSLSLKTRGEYPVTLQTLALGNDVTINIDRLEGTDYANAAKAAFDVDSWSVGEGNTLTLNFTFGEGLEMDAVKTYNLFASAKDIAKTPLGALNILYADKDGQMVKLDPKNYVTVYTQVGGKHVFFIRTRFGNVWVGDTATGSGTWSMAGNGANWKDGSYKDGTVGGKNAIFADLTGSDGKTALENATVALQDVVQPGNVYFDARTTGYVLQETGAGKLAADTVIHTSGLGDVTLDLANNATMENAIKGLNVHRGAMALANHDLAFSGSIVIDPVIQLEVALKTGEQYVVSRQYKAKGTFKGVTLEQGSIAGTSELLQAGKSSIENASIIANEAGGVTLSNVVLTGDGTGNEIKNATIGSGVSIGANGNYTLSGTVWFDDTLKLADTAHVTILQGSKTDIGGLRPEMTYDDEKPEDTVYTYTLVQNADGSDAAAGSLSVPHANENLLLLNGVTVSSIRVGENEVKINYCQDGNGNNIPGKIKLTLKGGDFTPWDERWGGKGPVAAVTNVENSVLYDGSITDETERDKYLYSKVVAGEGNEKMVVASISRTWGSTDAGNKNPLIGSTGTDKEIWIYNHGSGNFSTLVTGSATEGSTQSGATHLMVMGGQAGAETVTVGGSRDATQTGESFVTIDVGSKEDNKKTQRGIVMGGSYGLNQAVTQTGASHLYMNDGAILTMLIAGSYEADMAADTFLDISGGTMETVYGGSYAKEHKDRGNTAGNITATLTGGEIKTFYGGGSGNTGGETDGQRKKLAVTLDGSKIGHFYASNNGGNVTADIVVDLISGSAEKVMVAAAGTEVHGSYTVRLHEGFTLVNAASTPAGIYGGRDRDTELHENVLHENSDFTSKLELVDAGATYDFFPGGVDNEDQVREIRGFDEISLADLVTLRVDNRHFCNNTDVILSTLNKGDMATVVFGKANADKSGSSRNDDRIGSMTLKEGITFKLETSYGYGNAFAAITSMPKIHVESGSMVDLTGFPREQGISDDGGCFGFQMFLAGDGIDGKGAIYKGAGEYSTSPDGKVAMPHIVLTDNASINAAASNIIVCSTGYADSFMELQGHTLTKIGPQVLRLYASQEKATDGTPGKGGTFFIKEGVADYLQAADHREVDYVLGKEGTLELTAHEDGTSLVLRSLSGNGTVNLAKNVKLTLESDYQAKKGVFYKDWLSQGKYNNTNSGGYAYGVFSGTIVSDDASSELIKSGAGTQLLTGSDSTYQGLTKIQQGTLYLVGSSSGTLYAPGTTATMQKGVVGQSSIVWESVDGSTPLLLLGEGVRIFNDGYALGGSDMLIAVSAAEQGASAMNYVVTDAEGHYVTVERDGKTYYQMDTSRIKSVNATGFYADAATGEGKDYAAGNVIDRNRTLYLSAEELGVTVGASLQTDSGATTLNYTVRDCEQIDVGGLQGAGLTSLDCNGYYGNGTAYKAGTAIDAALVESRGGLFVTQNGMSPTAGRYLLYAAQPAIAYVPDGSILAEDGPVGEMTVDTGTPYVQYDLGNLAGQDAALRDPAKVPEALRGSDTLFYVKLWWKDTHGATIVNRYMTYAGVQAVAAGEMKEATLINIDRVLFKEGATLTAGEEKAVEGLVMVMGEEQLVSKDITISLEGLKVKDGVSIVAADGYYADAGNTVTGVYHAGDAIDTTKGTLYIPSSSQDKTVVVVTGLNDSGYEEATYSGVLSDHGNESPSHLTKLGKGTLTIDQRNLYSGNTNLREGTLNLKGWGQLHRHADRAYDFNQSRGTSLKLSYDNSYQSEAKELATNLTITGSGDARWLNEETTGNRTAALISDVDQDVSFTLSGDISGDGNVLHSGKGQLHMSGNNSYEGGTAVTDGVVYVESATALGATAGDNMASKVVVTKHTADGKGGTLVITNRPEGRDALSGYVRFNSNRNAIEGTVYIGGWDQGADITDGKGTGANDTAGATLLMTGNGYWAEKTILSSRSALIFNGTASSNKEIEGSVMHEAGLLTGSGILAVSGPAGKGTTVRFANIGNPAVALLAEAETEGFQGSIRVEGNNSRLEIGQGNYHAGEGKSISISGYNATLEAANTAISVGSGGSIELASLGYLEEENGRGAAVLQAGSVSVEAGGSLATRNIGTIYRYNLAAIEEATQVSTHESLIGNRSAKTDSGQLEYNDTTKAKWKDMQADLGLPTKVDPQKPYTRSFIAGGAGGQVVNTNRAALVDSDLSFAKGSTYEASYANTSLGNHALTLESGAGGNSKENRVTLDLSLNGSILQWDEKGRSTSQIVLFTDVSAVNFIYNGQAVNTDADAYNGVEIFYMAAQDFFYDAYQGRYLDQDTLLVYDKGAQIVYLDRALPEPATATLSLLALAALVARRRRK